MRPLFSMMMDLIINSIMDLGPDYERRIWLIIDELPALNKIPSIPILLSEGRKYGLCFLSGLQSMNQLSDLYGFYEASSMFGQFNTKFIFRTDEQNIAKQISDMFGTLEYQQSSENISYGAHEMRDGVSFGKQERTKPLVTPDDLASLPNLECYIKLPDHYCRIARIKTDYANIPEIALRIDPLPLLNTIKEVQAVIADSVEFTELAPNEASEMIITKVE